MMKASAGLQLNVDYTSEEDAATLMSTSLAVSPIVNALCLNSPITGGKPSGFLSRRPEIWLNTDPDRTGLIPWVLEAGFSFERYVEYALGVPVLFIVRGGKWANLGKKTFGQVLEKPGALGPITMADWHLHLTTLFPEVRIKQHIEIRGMDSCEVDLAAAIAAVWRGLLYDERAREESRGLVAGLDSDGRQELHLGVGREGLACRVGETSVGELAQDLVRIAREGLERLDADTPHDEVALLAPLEPILESGRSPAHDVLDAFAERGIAALAEWT
jgi:glutamate--cysteine ligase